MKSEWRIHKSTQRREKMCDRQEPSPLKAGEAGSPARSRGSSNLQFYFNTAIRLTAFLRMGSFIYSTFTLSPMSGGLESKKVL
jgi:hypothetical protein